MKPVREKITAKFLFAAIQSLLAFSAIILALLLNFNLLSIQSSLRIIDEALNFYIGLLIIFGFTFLLSGFFIIYEWKETR